MKSLILAITIFGLSSGVAHSEEKEANVQRFAKKIKAYLEKLKQDEKEEPCKEEVKDPTDKTDEAKERRQIRKLLDRARNFAYEYVGTRVITYKDIERLSPALDEKSPGYYCDNDETYLRLTKQGACQGANGAIRDTWRHTYALKVSQGSIFLTGCIERDGIPPKCFSVNLSDEQPNSIEFFDEYMRLTGKHYEIQIFGATMSCRSIELEKKYQKYLNEVLRDHPTLLKDVYGPSHINIMGAPAR